MSKYRLLLDIQDSHIRCWHIRHKAVGWGVINSASRDMDSLSPETISSLLDDIGVKSPKSVVVVISGKDASIKLIELKLPNLHNHKSIHIDGVVRNILPEHLPMKVEQAYYDYQILKSDSYGTTLLVVAMKRNVLKGYMDILSKADIYPDTITISPIALFNGMAADNTVLMNDGKVGLIYLHDWSGDIAIVEDGVFEYGRSFSLQTGRDKEQVIREIANSFAAHLRTQTGQLDRLDTIHLVTDRDGVPIELTDDELTSMVPDARWLIRDDMSKLVPGMALINRTHIPLIEIDLHRQVLQDGRVSRQRAIKARLRRGVPAIIAFSLFILALILGWQANSLRGELRSMDGVIQNGKAQLTLITELNNRERELLARASSLSWVVDGYPMLSYRLYCIAKATPESLWLKEMYIPRVQQNRRKNQQEESRTASTLHIVGYAREQSQIESFLDRLRVYDCFTDVKQEILSEKMVSGERVLEFNIRLSSEPKG